MFQTFCFSSKLNIPKVLLPLAHSTRISFMLEATDGCYRWTSTRPDVAIVTAVYSDERQCSQKAILQVRSTQPARLTSIILAEDLLTGQVLRCDAIVNLINEIQIISTTRELFLEDSPLEFKIHAFDSEGNTFSNLAGLIFEWTIEKDEDIADFTNSYNAAKLLKFSESTYTPPHYISELEKHEKQGDTVLVSGIKTGNSKLKARIQETLYKDVPAAEVRLLILENIILEPAYDIYILVSTSVKYKAQKFSQGTLTEIEMPCDQYELQLQNSIVSPDGEHNLPVAKLERATSTVTALQLGQTNIVLDHKNIRLQDASRLPNSTIYIVEADHLGFAIQPGNRWVLETGRKYEILIEVFDKAGNKIYVSDNIRIRSEIPSKYFNILQSSISGCYHHVEVLEKGLVVIEGALSSVVDQVGAVHVFPTPVYKQQEAEIYDPIVLTPAVLAFPWQPKVGEYTYIINANGGSGNFSWFSSKHAVAMVTFKGVITSGIEEGVSVIRAHDTQNPLHYGEMKVYVIEPVGIEFTTCPVEALVGLTLELPLRIFGILNMDTGEKVMLSDCSQLDLSMDVDNQGIFHPLPGRLNPGPEYCSGLRVQAESSGYTTLHVCYNRTTEHRGHVQLRAQITIAAYEPLKAVDPPSVALVTLASSKDMLFEGGPKPWVLEPSRFFRNLSAEVPESVALSIFVPTSRNYFQHWVKATCRALGEQVLSISVGNQPCPTNTMPIVERVLVKFVCALPARLSLLPVHRDPQLDLSCPLRQQSKQMVPVSNDLNPVLEFTVYNEQGVQFDNFSSLIIAWNSKNTSLAGIEPSIPMQFIVKEVAHQQKKLQGHQTVIVHRDSGLATITVTVVGYQTSYLNDVRVQSPSEHFTPISANIELLLVEDVKVFPDTITIYNYPDVRGELTLLGGSGYFFVNSTADKIGNVIYQNDKGIVEVLPLSPGTLTVNVHDLCLAFPAPVVATVHISDIQEVYVSVVEKVEIGKYVNANVHVLDDNKNPFLAKYFNVMDLKLLASSQIVSLLPMNNNLENETAATFPVQGISVGQTSLFAVVMDKTGRRISSAPQPIEVFPPFRLIPRKMTIIIGAMMQITSEGGLQPQPSIVFSTADESIASVDEMGHVIGIGVGNVTVTGVAQAVDVETGKLVITSMDNVDVEVVQLKAVRIRAPITRMKTDTKMPVYVMGIKSSQTPFSFGNALPGLTFQWIVSKRDVLDVQTRHSEAMLQLPLENNFVVIAYGKAEGRTGLKVIVKATQPAAGHLEGNLKELSDEIQIQVFEKPYLLNPQMEPEEILMSPNSFLRFETNRDAVATIRYKPLGCPNKTPLVQVDEKGIITSNSLTGMSSLEVNSQESFGVSQSIIIAVKVSPVSYMRISTSPTLYTFNKELLSAIPLGATLTLTAHVHDNTGDSFHAHNSMLTFATNRDDLVLVGKGTTNNSFVVRTLNVGLTILAVWDTEHHSIADYVALPVQHAIMPDEAENLVVGDVICFSSSLVNQEGLSGTWSASSDQIIEMDPRTGAGVVKDSGATTVYYEIPGMIKAHREVIVSYSEKTIVMASTAGSRNVAGGVFSRPLITTREKGSNLIGHCSPAQIEAISDLHPESNVDCQLQFSSDISDLSPAEAFTSQTGFDPISGYYTCSLSMQRLNHQQLKLLFRIPQQFLIVKAAIRGADISGVQVTAEVPFTSRFHADETEIMLNSLHDAADITVYGPSEILSHLEVKSGSPLIDIRQKETSYGIPSFVKYSISMSDSRLLTQGEVSTGISISSPLTEQSIIIPVTVIHAADGSTAMQRRFLAGSWERGGLLQQFIDSYHIMFFTFFALLAGTAIVIIAFHTIFSPNDQVYHPPFMQTTPSQPGYSSSTLNLFRSNIPPNVRRNPPPWLFSTD
ncbi:nuclear pore membrane glycoprotein 210-like [Polypterus senegalus]|uniref:nuclear pore membrane glycoprotein 210-like n=1 Tax=Polypterus senegalus TaxID=55291 RepID=UPI001966265C|nr:nuclear pore membrane glycoprotein 210-like [Polypterus senegalus]